VQRENQHRSVKSRGSLLFFLPAPAGLCFSFGIGWGTAFSFVLVPGRRPRPTQVPLAGGRRFDFTVFVFFYVGLCPRFAPLRSFTTRRQPYPVFRRLGRFSRPSPGGPAVVWVVVAGRRVFRAVKSTAPLKTKDPFSPGAPSISRPVLIEIPPLGNQI